MHAQTAGADRGIVGAADDLAAEIDPPLGELLGQAKGIFEFLQIFRCEIGEWNRILIAAGECPHGAEFQEQAIGEIARIVSHQRGVAIDLVDVAFMFAREML